MYLFILIIHIFVCLFLVVVILLQAGKGGGMAETLGGNITQSILGTRSSAFMTKVTAVCATLFLITCLSLTYLASQKRASLFRGYKLPKSSGRPATVLLPPQSPADSTPAETSIPTESPAQTGQQTSTTKQDTRLATPENPATLTEQTMSLLQPTTPSAQEPAPESTLQPTDDLPLTPSETPKDPSSSQNP
jgi:preprotein translocase subunit SecG